METGRLDPQIGTTGYNAAVNGRGQIIAIVAVGISLGGLIINGQRSTSRDIAELRNEVSVLRNEVHAEIADLRERMARLEGLFEGFTKREAAP